MAQVDMASRACYKRPSISTSVSQSALPAKRPLSLHQPLYNAAYRAPSIRHAVSSTLASRSSGRPGGRCHATTRPAVHLFGFGGDDDEEEDEPCTVLKLQVGIFGDIPRWQRDLERLSTLYDTDQEGGLHAIFQETLQLLLRNTEYISYAASGGRVYPDLDAAESKFNEVSFEERAKFKEETLTNVDGRTQRSLSRSGTGLKDLDQWLCLTLILALDRELKLPRMSSVFELKQVIKTLGGVRVDDLLAYEMMWTPQDEGDSYSKDELLADYPQMLTLS